MIQELREFILRFFPLLYIRECSSTLCVGLTRTFWTLMQKSSGRFLHLFYCFLTFNLRNRENRHFNTRILLAFSVLLSSLQTIV